MDLAKACCTENVCNDCQVIETGLDESQFFHSASLIADSSNISNIQDESAALSVTVFIAGILAGYLIDGVLIYYTGYSGGELCAQGLQALESLTARNSQITQAYFNSVNSNYVDVYHTSDGNECIRTSGLTYACKYSVR